MAVCVFDPLANDFLIDFSHWGSWDDFDPVYDENGDECKRSEKACYFLDPCAWMPLPPPPIKIMDDQSESEYAMSVYPLFDAVESVLKSTLLSAQQDQESRRQLYKISSPWGEEK